MNNEEAAKLAEVAVKALNQGNYEKASGILQRLAFHGSASPMYLLAIQYRDGRGLPQSNKHAEYWLRESTGRGYKPAILALAAIKGTPGQNLQTKKILSWAVLKGYITPEEKESQLEEIERIIDKEMRNLQRQMKRSAAATHNPIASVAV